MNGFQEWTIPAQNVKSLCWQGDALVDWVAGGNRYYLDGTVKPRHVRYGYRFDTAVVSPSGTYAVIYEKLGTKGLVLKNGDILREINRSFYYANAYEYPVVLFQLPDGREVIAHCPDTYRRIEIDELETGKRLTDIPNRKPIDYFYSRLSTNQSQTHLMSAGWVWQPWDTVRLFDIEAVLENPTLLDSGTFLPPILAEVSNAAFLNKDKLVLATSMEQYDQEEDTSQLLPTSLGIYDIHQNHILTQVTPEALVGTIMPLGSNRVVGFYEHPKLIDLATGKMLFQWIELNSGKQTSSIIWGIDPVPPLALDPANSRFAVADDKAIHVIQVNPDAFLNVS